MGLHRKIQRDSIHGITKGDIRYIIVLLFCFVFCEEIERGVY